MKKLYSLFVIMFVFCMCSIHTYAEETSGDEYIDEDASRITVTEITDTTWDYSNTYIEVTEYVNGQNTAIYTGLLGGYENGMYSFLDFSEVDIAVIFDWDSDTQKYIREIDDNASESITDSFSKDKAYIKTAENIIDAFENGSEEYDLIDNGLVTNYDNGEVTVITKMQKHGKMLNVSYALNNLTSQVEPTRIVSAIYRNGKIENMVMGVSEIQSFGAWHQTLNIYLPDDLNGVTIKCMAWNEYSMQPYCPAIEITTGLGDVENYILTNETETINIGERFLFKPKYNGLYSFIESGSFNIFKISFGEQTQIANNTTLLYPNTYLIEPLSSNVEITNESGYNTEQPLNLIGSRKFSVTEGNTTYFADWTKGGIICKDINGEEFVVCNDKASWLEISGDYLYYKNLLDNGKLYKVPKTADNMPAGSLVQ